MDIQYICSTNISWRGRWLWKKGKKFPWEGVIVGKKKKRLWNTDVARLGFLFSRPLYSTWGLGTCPACSIALPDHVGTYTAHHFATSQAGRQSNGGRSLRPASPFVCSELKTKRDGKLEGEGCGEKELKGTVYWPSPKSGNSRTGGPWSFLLPVVPLMTSGRKEVRQKCASPPRTAHPLGWRSQGRCDLRVEKAGRARPTHRKAPMSDLETALSSSRHFTSNSQ